MPVARINAAKALFEPAAAKSLEDAFFIEEKLQTLCIASLAF